MRIRSLLFALLVPGLAPGVSRAQAVDRTDSPRAKHLRVAIDPLITIWDNEFIPSGGRRPVGASLPARVFVHAERRVTPVIAEFGVTDRIAVTARLPLVRVMTRAHLIGDSAGRVLDSLLADTAYGFAPIGDTPRLLRYFAGDAELSAKVRLGRPTGPYQVAGVFLIRLPTGHLDSPNDLFDIPTGDHQTDVEVRLLQELTVKGRLWLNLAIAGASQRAGARERRVAPEGVLLVPRAALARLNWKPGAYLSVDFAPLYRFNEHFAAGPTLSYFTKRRDRYQFMSAGDSVALATRLGAPRSASVLDAGTAERRLRLGGAVSYLGPWFETAFSVQQTVTAAGGFVPAATEFRLVLKWSRWPL